MAAGLVAFAAPGCLGRPAEMPAPTPEAARAPSEASTPPEPSLAAPSAASGPTRLGLALVGSRLWLDGQDIAPLKRIDYVDLFARLRQRRAAARGGDVATFELKVDETADSQVTQNILSLTGDAGYERAELLTGAGRVSLCTEECGEGAEAEPSKAQRTVVMLRRNAIAVWSGREVRPDPSGAVDAEPEKLFEASWAEPGEFEAGIQRVCSESARCDRVVVYFDAELPGRALVSVLESIDRAVRAARAAPPAIRLALWVPPASGEEAYAFVRVPDDAGRLPPVVIRQVVRASYGTFRECYMRGLAAQPRFSGQVMVRFVILSDGTVSSVSQSGGDLPSDVTNCVLHGFARIRFPAPKDGIVTVQYPILMIPPG